MNLFCKICRDIFTGKDNKTYDIHRVLTFFGAIILFYRVITATIYGHPLNLIEFATAVTILLAGSGVGIALKQRAEPNDNNSKEE